MRSLVRSTLLLPLLATLGASATDSAAQTPITGIYAAEGTNGDGSAYRALVFIREHEDAFRIEWIFPSRRAVAGLGILSGDVLAVSYFGSSPGIAVYEVEDDRLVGRWTIVGAAGLLSKETLTRIPEHSIPEPSRRPPGGTALML